MNTRLLLTLSLALFTGAALAQDPDAPADAQEGQAMGSDPAKVSYALGLQAGANMAQRDLDLNVEAYTRGFNHGLGDGEPEMTQDEVRQTLDAFRQEQQKKQAEIKAREGEENLAAGQAFLAENAERKEVTTLDSGLQYEVLEESESEVKPAKRDVVQVHYTGRLIDGTVFDSSVERGQVATFPVDRVIPGWTEALQLMTVGSKWRIVVPAHLGYGERGAPPRIGPNAVLDFEVELIGIN